MTETKATAETIGGILAAAGFGACPKCGGLFTNLRLHRCYEDTLEALLFRLKTGKTAASSTWELSAILASHTGYEYTCVLNRNFSGTRGTGRAAVGIAFATPEGALQAAINIAARVDADPTTTMDDKATAAWLAEPEG